MATKLAKNKSDENQLIRLAQKRLKLPANWLEMEYRNESDVLLIRCSLTAVAKSKGDMKNGIVYNYDSRGDLARIEVTDFYGIYV